MTPEKKLEVLQKALELSVRLHVDIGGGEMPCPWEQDNICVGEEGMRDACQKDSDRTRERMETCLMKWFLLDALHIGGLRGSELDGFTIPLPTKREREVQNDT